MKQRQLLMTAGWTAILVLVGLFLGAGIAAATDYEYDGLGRVVKVAYDDGNTIEYEYDAAGDIVRMVSTGRDWRSIDDTLQHSNEDKKPRPWKPEEDTFRFVGTMGEVVTIRLEAEPREDGADKKALLLLRDTKHEKKPKKTGFVRTVDGFLPSELTLELPGSGEMYVVVREGTYQGGYRLTLEARPETCATFQRVGGTN